MASATAEDPPDFGSDEDEVEHAPAPEQPQASLASAADAALASLGDIAGTTDKAPAAAAFPPKGVAAGVPVAAPAAPKVLPPGPLGPHIVMPPSATGAAPPPPEGEDLPMDHDGEAWLELLRDGHAHQMREENECEEPPPFHRAMQFAADPPIPAGKFPRMSLNLQLQLLLRLRAGGMEAPPAPPPLKGGKQPQKAGGKGGVVPPLNAQSVIKQINQGVMMPMTPQEQQKQAQLLRAAATALQGAAVAKAGSGTVVPPKGGLPDPKRQRVQ